MLQPLPRKGLRDFADLPPVVMPLGFPVLKTPVVDSAKCVHNSPDSPPALRHPWLAPSASGRPKSGGVHPPEARQLQPHGNPAEPDQEQIGAGFLPATASVSHSKSSGGGCAPLSSLRAYGASVATSTPCGGRAALPHRPRPAAPPPAKAGNRKGGEAAQQKPREPPCCLAIAHLDQFEELGLPGRP